MKAFTLALAFVLASVAAIGASGVEQGAGAQMPDAKQMSGMPLPSPDVPVGTLTVRVVLGSMDKPIAGMTVEITGEKTARAETGEDGRATFTGIQPGTVIKAIAVVGSERLESQGIKMPLNGGMRVALVATDPELEKKAEEDRKLAAGPAQKGTVVLGAESRFVSEIGDGGLNVFNIFQILNTARVPVDPGAALVFPLPEGAEHAEMMEGSTPLAAVKDANRVEVKGPFPPGASLVQYAYTLPYSGPDITVRQTIPAQMAQLTVIAQKVGNMHLTSPQMTEHGDREAEGQTYILGQGPALAAGATAEFAFTGLPHSATWPRDLALTLVVLVLAAGAFFSLKGAPGATPAAERKRLEARREKLFADLTALEASYRAARVDPDTYTARRQHLIASLERVYAALDEEAAA